MTGPAAGGTSIQSRDYLNAETVLAAIPDLVAARRLGDGLSQRDVARATGLANSTVHNAENGRYSVETARALLRWLAEP